MSPKTKHTEERFVQELVERFDVDTYVAYEFIRRLAAANLVVIDNDDYTSLVSLKSGLNTLVRAFTV